MNDNKCIWIYLVGSKYINDYTWDIIWLTSLSCWYFGLDDLVDAYGKETSDGYGGGDDDYDDMVMITVMIIMMMMIMILISITLQSYKT